MVEGGADVLEVGVAFSDPIADGPVIQAASERALKAGATLKRVLRRGGARGAPALPPDAAGHHDVRQRGDGDGRGALREAGRGSRRVGHHPAGPASRGERELREAFDAAGVDLIPLCAPTTPPARAESIAKDARGFVYCVSVAGVTGMRAELPADLSERLELVRRRSPVPVVAGFGISTAEQAQVVAAHADGVVVGSAIVRAAQADGPAAARQVCAEIKRGLKR